jgi:hypothetical protein
VWDIPWNFLAATFLDEEEYAMTVFVISTPDDEDDLEVDELDDVAGGIIAPLGDDTIVNNCNCTNRCP